MIVKHYTSFITVFMLLISLQRGNTQTDEYIKQQLPQATQYDVAIIDSVFGIKMYEKLNYLLGGDSIRNCKGYACSGWVEDYWKNGLLLHKGYYVDGKLKIYQNYYPNGQLERAFRTIDDYRSTMKQYYADGTLKSEAKFFRTNPMKWEDYYANGQLEYYEEYDKSGEYYIAQRSYTEDGHPVALLELTDKKKLLYTSKEYYDYGKIKEEGEIKYNPDMLDYQKTGKWMVYDEQGELIKDEFYINGTLNKEKVY